MSQSVQTFGAVASLVFSPSPFTPQESVRYAVQKAHTLHGDSVTIRHECHGTIIVMTGTPLAVHQAFRTILVVLELLRVEHD